MALKSPLMPSPTGGLTSSFSPYTDSPNSPAPFTSFNQNQSQNQSQNQNHSNRSSGPSDSLAPPPSPYPSQIEPSPVDSNGTESTEIEEDAQEDAGAAAKSPAPAGDGGGGEVKSPDIEISSPQSAGSERPQAQRLITTLPNRPRSDSQEDAPQSVIHVPEGFKDFKEGGGAPETAGSNRTSPKAEHIPAPVRSPATPEAAMSPSNRRGSGISPVNTDVPRFSDRSTPRAQTMREVEDEFENRKSKRLSSLEDIPETNGKDEDEDGRPSTAGLVGDGSMSKAQKALSLAEQEIAALRTALSECWTLCNTLAGLSSTHRNRTFKFAGRQDQQEQAWRSCWRLCQQLYEARDEDYASQTTPTLELCRDFCQSLFEARSKGDEATDSVLRVSFELNNHLYNTHDRSLPDAFNERTLDFYITLCHRLMKLPMALPQETDALLRACWSLAEMLFNLRQSTREARAPDEELLGSAVQACWELCDLFREGWTQIRPDRGTPRPSQTTFPPFHSSSSKASHKGSHKGSTRGSATERSGSSLSNRQYHDASASLPPETPTTIFDDSTTAASSPDSVSAPNILVLGPASSASGSLRNSAPHHDRWSSNASVLSGYSESASSQRTSSTATAGSEEAHLSRLRYLLLKAAFNTGYSRSLAQPLPTYIQSLPNTSFGSLPWQVKVFGIYQKLVMNDKSMGGAHLLPARRLGASEAAKSVKWLGRNESWVWMRDLYRLVFGFGIDEVERRGGSVQV